MKCPHCGKYVPVSLNQPPVRIPETVPRRWPDAREFMSLVFALDGNMRDATLLCLMAEDQIGGRKVASKRELAERSGGLFAVNKNAREELVGRVCGGKAPKVLDFGMDSEGDDSALQVNVSLVRRLALEQAETTDPAFLWFNELTEGCFREALVLSLLLQAGGDKEPQRLTGRKLLELSGGLYTDTREIYRALSRLSPIRGGGVVQQPEYRYWALDSAAINSRLAQQAVAWVGHESPVAPWEAGLRLILATADDAATTLESIDLAQS
ncbi:hypothetical protein Dsui_2614 [Azospira oryzae PS]|uniref:Uncharacterized protein n=2 Tax=Azospira oryzae TaxID=146939 RepID=G8QNS1_AZOOP|nr:hypothetical protein Dsui_2614 [Azospira oryzae PS]